jgi:hypothetical protein
MFQIFLGSSLPIESRVSRFPCPGSTLCSEWDICFTHSYTIIHFLAHLWLYWEQHKQHSFCLTDAFALVYLTVQKNRLGNAMLYFHVAILLWAALFLRIWGWMHKITARICLTRKNYGLVKYWISKWFWLWDVGRIIWQIYTKVSVALVANLFRIPPKCSYCGIFSQSKNCGARETAVARQWFSIRHVIVANNAHAIIEEVLEKVFSVWSVLKLYNEDQRTLQRIRPCDLRKIINSLKLRKACGIDGIPNECPRHLPRRPLVHLTHLFNHCLRLSHFPNPWKESKVRNLPKSGKDPKFHQNLRPISLLSTTRNLFEKVFFNYYKNILKMPAQRKPVWFPCTSQHDVAMYVAGGPRDP